MAQLTLPNAFTSTPTIPAHVNTTYRDTTISNPLSIGNKNLKTLVNVGVANSVSATGSVLAFDTSLVVANTSQAGAEHCPMFGVLRYDQGTGFANSGTPGRAWLTDWTVHGAIETQQELLNGVNLVMANYYNGQPTDSVSGGIWVAAHPDIGGAVDATHAAATTYPVGVGVAVVGVSSGSARGWNVGVQVGGAGSGWEVATSRVGTGVLIRDYDTTGLSLTTQQAATARAILVDDLAGNVIIGKDITTVGTDFTEAKVTVARSNTALAVGTGQGNAHHIFAASISNQAIDTGATIGLGGQVSTGVYRAFGVIAGRKTNGNVSDSSGYLQFCTHKNGVGLREWMRLSEDGLLTLSDAANIATNATTGTKIATASTQKLGFFGATPVVQQAGVAVTAGGIHAALVTLGLITA